MAFARRNHHLAKGEKVKWSRKGKGGSHAMTKSSDRGVVTSVSDTGYRVKWTKGALKGSSTFVLDDMLVSARSTSRAWPGNHYEGIDPKARKNPNDIKCYEQGEALTERQVASILGLSLPMLRRRLEERKAYISGGTYGPQGLVDQYPKARKNPSGLPGWKRRLGQMGYAEGLEQAKRDFERSMDPGFEVKTKVELEQGPFSPEYIRGYLDQIRKEEKEWDRNPPTTEDDLYEPDDWLDNPRARKNAYRHSDLMHVHGYDFPVGRKNPDEWSWYHERQKRIAAPSAAPSAAKRGGKKHTRKPPLKTRVYDYKRPDSADVYDYYKWAIESAFRSVGGKRGMKAMNLDVHDIAERVMELVDPDGTKVDSLRYGHRDIVRSLADYGIAPGPSGPSKARKNPMHWPKTISSKLGKWKQVEAGDEYASYDLSKRLPGNEEYTVIASAEKTAGGWKVSFFEESTMGGKEIITSKGVGSPLSAIKAMKAHWPKPALLLPARDPRLGGRLARNNMGFKLTDPEGIEHEADTFSEYLQMKDAMGGGKKKRSRTSAVRRKKTKKAFSPPRNPTAPITEKQGYGLLKWIRPSVKWEDAVEGMIAHGMTQQQWYDAIQLASKKQKIPAMKRRIEEWARG